MAATSGSLSSHSLTRESSVPIVGGGAFVSPFEWNENSIVIIKYKHGGGHIRAHPHNHELCDHKGGQTEWAKWKVHLSDNGRIAQLEHVKTGKYLQMDKFITSINVASEGGSTSRWIVHPVSSNCVRLESERNEGYFLGVKPHDGVTVVNGDNLDSNSYQYQFTFLYFFIEGQKDEGYFKKPYELNEQNTIIIKHPLNASLRTNPNDERELDINGQKEMNARWEAIVTNVDANGNETNKNNNSSSKPNTSVSSPSESASGSTSMTSAASDSSLDISATTNSPNGSTNHDSNLANGSTDNNNNNNNNDTETKTDDNTNNVSDSVKITDGSDPLSDNKESNDIDKNRKQKSIDSKDDDSDVYDDSHEKTNVVLQFRSVKSGGFIQLHDNRITMSRKGDDYTKFRVYIVEQPNIVKLESTQHPGCYIRITEKKGIHVGKGGPHCQMTLLRME